MAEPHFRNFRVPVLKLIVISLIVGLLLSLFNMRPEELLTRFGDTVRAIFSIVVGWVETAVPYILLGAVVVIPIWLALVLWRYVRGKI